MSAWQNIIAYSDILGTENIVKLVRKGEDNRKWILDKYQVTDKLQNFDLLERLEEEVQRLEFLKSVSFINCEFDSKGTSKEICGVAEEWIPGK